MSLRRLHSLTIPLRVALTILLLISVASVAKAQDNASSARLRNLNNQLLTVYERLLASPAADAPGLRSQGEAIIQQRAAALGAAMGANPSQVLQFALSDNLLSDLGAAFPSAAGQLERPGSWSGVLDFIVEMDPDLVGYHNHYGLTVGGENLKVHFAGKEPEGAQCRDVLEVVGVRIGDNIAAASGNVQQGAVAGAGCTTTGDQKTIVLLVTNLSVPAPAISAASVANIFFGTGGRSVSGYWKEASYGVTSASGDVVGWLTLNADYTCDDYYNMRAAAIAAADGVVNFTQYTRLALIFPTPATGCSWAGLGTIGCSTISSADGNFTASTAWMLATYFTSVDQGVKLATHELGHNLGLHHASSRAFTGEALSAPGTAGTLSEYGDVFSTMGSWNLGHYAAPHKKMLNWMSEGGKIRTVTSNGSFSVQPYEMNAGTLQALKIQRGTGGTDWVWLEFRQPTGNYDTTLSSQIFSGATIHYEDSTSGIHTHLLDFTPETSSFSDPALAASKSWTDPYTNLSISITTATSTALNVDVIYGPLPCVAGNPTVTLSPNNPSVYAPGAVNYNVSVKNNDTAGCSPRDFTLTYTTPSWTSTFALGVLTIAPGGAATTAMTKTVAAGTTPGTYAVDATAGNAGNSGTGLANVTVQPPLPPLSASLSVPKPTYGANTSVPMTATVLQGSSPVAGASVTFTLTRPDGTTTKTQSTGTNGQTTWSYKINPKGAKGTYKVTAQTTYGSQTASAAAITFTVQ